jgi:methionyl-tRNA formyltransferase
LQISVASSSLISLPIIEAIMGSEHTLASIITHPDRKVGRGQGIEANPLAAWASEKNLLVAKPADISEINKHLLDVQPQLVITASYGKLIPPELLHGPRFGWLNLHFSLLPKWRGAAPVQWAILEGDEITGITVFKLDKGMDTGPIYSQEEIAIDDHSTTEELLDLMSLRGADLVLDAVGKIKRAERPKPQSTSGITLAPKISKEMGELDWDQPAIVTIRKIRALAHRPGTFTSFRGSLLRIHNASLTLLRSENRRAGEIWSEGASIYVQCIDGIIEIGEVTPAGKKRMSAVEFMRGARLEAGERLQVSVASE